MYLIKASDNYCAVDKDIFIEWKDSFWCLDNNGYAIKRMGNKNVRLHSLIIDIPKGFCVDHINRNKLDCRRRNLRICTRRQNSLNRAPKNKHKGVFKHSQYDKWCVQFCGKHLGVFNYKENAALRYNQACGEDDDYDYCYLNFREYNVQHGFKPTTRDKISNPSKGKSKYKGVTSNGAGWVARLTVDRKRKYLGYFVDEESAAKAIEEFG